ncbi:hypothetical protein H6G54_28510 [Anabaena cylindrica FACHB-243]|uniref:Uncharacterized protein n=1 Tax=Anabaena cylindrica (strain ATCC 27899 / PCC 7122) TaxID=272123 RepID=K9ZRN8_ANACC|nr:MULTISPECIES: hypothetical protein [Anabaena]AFZ61434.1 hypothetical protein Anacy_6165 [Anabaena cylindrica PCC 7122]MBD2421550.1 hypothetical protein [Anabaena cylindrica FACHB-243]MBY5284249.1 hypothetical protein [Anabaena sp. CCAP 1446/1C]MBY5310620.1 hypothetical protein [Anabaena sp. CCAP 1446/1C]MCM2405965.1 hypothetical protein [Anabaena sp. CCAP 1446/1C]
MPRKRRNNKGFDDLFTDYCLTKTELTDILGVSRDSIVRWSKLALYRIPSFRDAYPKKSDGDADNEAPLNPYQCWVISRIARDFAKLGTAERVRLGITKNTQNYSVYTYRTALRNLNKIAA